ncbi:MAG: hypothetical protein KatS3mg043_2035 [Rhodothermaceae bacterium]|nr:MAG: hypothetical protein KatS3mg043_2035 [Rhodothermaceae bacterium]
MEKCHPTRMKSRRVAQTRARAERRLRLLAWRLGVTPKLLRAVMLRPPASHRWLREENGGGLLEAA